MTIPDNFKTGITGAELLKVGIQCAEDAGFKWPVDWQYRFTENEPFVTEGQNSMSLDATYRINPERLKPKAPRVLHLRDTGLDDEGNGRRIWTTAGSGYEKLPFIELKDNVRRRLSEDAGVDKFKVAEIVISDIGLHGKTTKIMKLIADAAVEVKE